MSGVDPGRARAAGKRRRVAYHLSRVDRDELDAGTVTTEEQAVRLPAPRPADKPAPGAKPTHGRGAQGAGDGADARLLEDVPPHW